MSFKSLLRVLGIKYDQICMALLKVCKLKMETLWSIWIWWSFDMIYQNTEVCWTWKFISHFSLYKNLLVIVITLKRRSIKKITQFYMVRDRLCNILTLLTKTFFIIWYGMIVHQTKSQPKKMHWRYTHNFRSYPVYEDIFTI